MIIYRKNRNLDLTKKVRVYRNLNNGLLSIKQGNLVVAYADTLTLTDVKFIISKSGQNRVRKEKRKNVHAFVEGIITLGIVINGNAIDYNPYLYDTFVFESGEPVENLEFIYIDKNGKMKGE